MPIWCRAKKGELEAAQREVAGLSAGGKKLENAMEATVQRLELQVGAGAAMLERPSAPCCKLIATRGCH